MSLALSINKNTIRKSLLILFFLTLPNSIAINNIAFGLLIFYWLLFENKKETLKLILNNPINFIIYLYIFFLSISLLWSEDLIMGIKFLKRNLILLSIPILMQLIKNEEKELLIKVFIIAMTVSEILSYLIKLNILPPIFHATAEDPTPFMNHLDYNTYLAFAIYLLLYFLFTTKQSKWIKILSIFFIVTMSINMFITGGRTGQIVFFILLAFAIFQFLKVNLKSILIVFTLIPIIFFVMYNFSDIFHKRVNLAINDIQTFNKQTNTSIGARILFIQNALQLIKENPILGTGIGDYHKEYEKISKKLTPHLWIPDHPHNMYVLVWAESGIFTFLSFILIFINQLLVALKLNDKLKPIRVVFPIFFLLIMFSNAYLILHYLTHLFIAFSAILYKEASWDLIFKGNK